MLAESVFYQVLNAVSDPEFMKMVNGEIIKGYWKFLLLQVEDLIKIIVKLRDEKSSLCIIHQTVLTARIQNYCARKR